MRTPDRRDTRREPSRIGGLIAHVSVYSELAEPQVLELATRAHLLHADRGTPVVRRGESMPGVISVSYGLLKLAARGVNGEERVLRLLAAGESFGAATILLCRPCPVDVVALADTLLVTIAATPILDLIDRDPKFARRLLLALAERNLGLLSEFADSALQRGVQRLASYLDSLARPLNGSGRYVAELPVAKAVVASRLGMKKETLSRLLHGLTQNGLVAVHGREIEILDRAGLLDVAQSGTQPPCAEAARTDRSLGESHALHGVI
ncbi:MAG TPA: Crp/Fnr family transcriptional regulator [Burkholderiales bacterium]|nr:Crp/Fnr family transcriptional regulator [Burkholderiales bacterium]